LPSAIHIRLLRLGRTEPIALFFLMANHRLIS
jgi:hypothetical protein